MSVESISWALNLEDPEMPPGRKLVLVGIANHDGDGGAWPSVATLARYANMTIRGVQKHLSELEKAGYITREIQEGGTRKTKDHQRPNRYVIHRVNPTSPGEPQFTPPVNPSSPPPVNPSSPEPSIEPSDEPSNPPVVPPKGDESLDQQIDDAFERWWSRYPSSRRFEKRKCHRNFVKAMKSMPDDEHRRALMEGIARWLLHWRENGVEEQFIPHTTRFINAEYWFTPPPAPVKPRRESATDVLERMRNQT